MSERRSRSIKPWALIVAGVVVVMLGFVRIALDSRRDPAISFVLGGAVIVIGLVMAAVRRSFR